MGTHTTKTNTNNFTTLFENIFGITKFQISFWVEDRWFSVAPYQIQDGNQVNEMLLEQHFTENEPCCCYSPYCGIQLQTPDERKIVITFLEQELDEQKEEQLCLFLKSVDTRWIDRLFYDQVTPQFPGKMFLGKIGLSQLLNENSFEGLAIFLDGRVLEYNNAFATIFGFEPGDVFDVANEEVIHPEDKEKVEFYTNQNKEYHYEVRAFHASGNEIWIEVHSRPMPDVHPNAKLIAIRDVTERKGLEEKYKKLLGQTNVILDSAQTGIISVDEEGYIQSINKRAEALLGIGEEVILHRCQISRFFDQEDAEKNEAVTNTFFKKDGTGKVNPFLLKVDKIQDYSCRFRTWNGKSIPVSISVSSLETGDRFGGKGFVGIIRDVSDNEELISKLNESQLMLSKTLENSQLGSWEYVLSENGIKLSKEAQNILGIEGEMLTFGMLKQFSHPDDWNRIKSKFFKMGTSNSLNLDFRVQMFGQQRWLNLKGFVYFLPGNILPKFTGTVMDITERKQIEQNLRIAQLRLEKAVKAREIFLANMSHEIRTPLHAILGYARLIKETANQSNLKGFAETITSSGSNLLGIINEVLDFSKLESATVEFSSDPFSINGVLDYIYDLFNTSAAEKGLAFVLEKPTTDVVVLGDKYRVNQVLTNLISNAIKFTDTGYVSVKGDVIQQDSFAHVYFEVEDTGIGIAETKQTSIFESFTQESVNTAKKFGGTGLGLSIVKSIVERLGGEISLKSKTGEGACFRIHLPLLLAESQDLPKVEDTQVPEALRQNLSKLSVLVVEDNLVNQQLVKRMIEAEVLDVTFANNGIEGVEAAKNNSFDIILMDLQMPEMDGFVATKEIRSLDEGYAKVPIIALSADVMQEEKDKCLRYGMNNHLAKPFTKEQLLKVLSNYVLDDVEEQPREEVSAEKEGLINLGYIHEATGGDVGKKLQLIQLVASKCPQQLAQCVLHAEEKNQKETVFHLHQLKGTLGLLSPCKAFDAVKAIEHYCKSENPDWVVVREKLQEFEGMIEDITDALSTIIQELHG